MKRIYNKIILSTGGIALSAIPMFVGAAYITNNEQAVEKNEFITKDFWYYSENKEVLDSIIIPEFENIANEIKDNEVVLSFIASLDGADLLEKDIYFKAIYYLNISEKQKLFLLQNYLDKYLSLSNAKAEAIAENNEKYLHAIKTSIYDEEFNVEEKEKDIESSEGGEEKNEETEPVESLTEDEEEHYLSLRTTANLSPLYNINNSRYEISSVNVYTAQAWDINENKGEIDRITNRYFSQVLHSINTTNGAGWINNDADTNFWSRRVAFTFRDKHTNLTDTINLVYNTAQDTSWTNEDYAFVGIQGTSTTKWAYDELRRKAPTIFGKPMSFDLMNLYNIGAKIDNNYMISAHQVDAGEDDDGGNILAGVPLAPSVHAREGNRSLRLIAKSFYEYIYIKLNEGLLQSKALNLYSSTYRDKNGIEQVNWYRDSSGRTVLRHGEDRKVTDYRFFGDDVTWFYWSNQTLLQTKIHNFNEQIKDEKERIEWAISTFNSLTFLDAEMINLLISYIVKFKDLSKIGGAVGVIASSIVINIVVFVGLGDFSNSAVEKFVAQLSIELVKLVGIACIRTFANALPIVNVVYAFIDISIMLLNWIPSGNGYSIWSNFGDHGLNDWHYQWKNNFDSMIKTGENFSENYKKGIVWRVEDGWFSLPNLFIATQGDNHYKMLSPGNEFNYGNKIGIHYRHY